MIYKKDFEKYILSLKIKGFEFESAVQAYLFNRKYKDKIEEIILSYRSYSPRAYYIDGITVSTKFLSVENCLTGFIDKYKIEKHFGESTIQNVLFGLENIDYSVFDLEINNEQSFNKLGIQINKIMEKGVMPFFEKFSNLTKVFEVSENLPIAEMANLICQPLPHRRMVIKKLCKDPYYHDYVDWLISSYQSDNDNGWKIIKQLDTYLCEIINL